MADSAGGGGGRGRHPEVLAGGRSGRVFSGEGVSERRGFPCEQEDFPAGVENGLEGIGEERRWSRKCQGKGGRRV